jgi:hypothetical protein
MSQENHPIETGGLDIPKGKLLQRDFATLGDNCATPPVVAIHPILSKADIVGKMVLAFGQAAIGAATRNLTTNNSKSTESHELGGFPPTCDLAAAAISHRSAKPFPVWNFLKSLCSLCSLWLPDVFADFEFVGTEIDEKAVGQAG